MAHTWSQAARNLGRNSRRSVIAGVALVIGVALCIATFGVVEGMSAQILHSLTRYDLGHVQVHAEKYVEDNELDATLKDPQAIMASAEKKKGVLGVSPRLYGFGLLSGGGKSAGVQLIGVDPKREGVVTEIDEQTTKGAFLNEAPTPWPDRRELTEAEKKEDEALTEDAIGDALAELEALDSFGGEAEPPPEEAAGEPPEEAGAGASEGESADSDPTRAPPQIDDVTSAARTRDLALAQSPRPEAPLPALLGVSLAKLLRAEVGDELFLSTATTEGQNESVFVKVSGIFQTGTQALDRNRLYLHIEDMGHLLNQEGQAHEVSVVLDDIERSKSFAAGLGGELKEPGLLSRSWDEIRPEIAQMLQLNDASMAIMVSIILFVAALGVVNTMLMAVFERTRELGVLKAIGSSPLGIVGLIMAESFLLVLFSSGVGVLGGLGLDYLLVTKGLDLSGVTGGMNVSNVGLNPVIYGVISLKGVLLPVVILAVLCMTASLYPAVRAARMQPAIGMRET